MALGELLRRRFGEEIGGVDVVIDHLQHRGVAAGAEVLPGGEARDMPAGDHLGEGDGIGFEDIAGMLHVGVINHVRVRQRVGGGGFQGQDTAGFPQGGEIGLCLLQHGGPAHLPALLEVAVQGAAKPRQGGIPLVFRQPGIGLHRFGHRRRVEIVAAAKEETGVGGGGKDPVDRVKKAGFFGLVFIGAAELLGEQQAGARDVQLAVEGLQLLFAADAALQLIAARFSAAVSSLFEAV